MENGKRNNLVFAVIGIGLIALLGLMMQMTGGNRNVLAAGSGYQGIIVNGEGTTAVQPDIARVNLGLEAEAATAKEAQRKNADQMAKIVAGLKALGLAEKDIQTTEFNLFPNRQYDKDSGQDKLVGYRATNQVTVTIRDLKKLGQVIDGSIQHGANTVNSVAFSVETPGKWREKAIAKAVAEARSKAEAMAKASGVRIRKIIAITESTIDIRPFQADFGYKRAEVLQAGADMAANTPMEPGNVKLTANVQISFGI